MVPDLPAKKRAEALQHGHRLDESKPGSGLGLSIVTGMSAMYHGNVSLGDASLGGSADPAQNAGRAVREVEEVI